MTAQPHIPHLYRTMCRIRYVEQAAAQLWREGLISGEMHLGAGEEAVAAGVVAHLGDGDAMAVDHRSTPAFVARGVDPEAILRELLGDADGLDGGWAGHMHLMSPEHLAAASGIVGSAGPLACGFGLAAAHRADGHVAVAFFGDGAINEGMLMEAFNLAAAWRLPVVFVCKDNGWSINTRTRTVTGGSPRSRAAAFGIPARRVDGGNVVAVWRVAGRMVRRARRGGGPSVLVARVSRPEGHFLGDRLLALTRDPQALAPELRTLVAALRGAGGASAPARFHSLARLLRTVGTLDAGRLRRDPLVRTRRRLRAADADRVEANVRAEIAEAVHHVRNERERIDA